MMDVTQIIKNSVVLRIQSGIAPSQDAMAAFRKSPELRAVQSNTECLPWMITITSDSSSFLPYHAHPYHGGAIRRIHLFPKHWDCNWEWLLAVKSDTKAVKTRHGTLNWAVCLGIAGSQGSTQKRRKKKSPGKLNVFPWCSLEHAKQQTSM